MGDFLSDHFSPELAFEETGVDRPRYTVPQAVNGAHLRYKRGYVDLAGFFTVDDVRLVSIRSNDRIHRMVISTGPLSMSIDLGLWQQGVAHDGPVLDADFFMSSVDINNVNQIEALTEAGNVTDEQRGLPLWEMMGLTRDPRISYDIVADQAVSTGIGDILLEIFFTRQGG